MEGVAAIAYACLKAYWRRKNYHRLLNAEEKNPPTEIFGSQSNQQTKNDSGRRFRIRKQRLKLGRFRFRLGLVRKFFLKTRDAYVNAMLRVGVSVPGHGGFVVGAKEYDEKTVVEIYKRIFLAQQQQGQGNLVRKIGYEVTPVCLFT